MSKIKSGHRLVDLKTAMYAIFFIVIITSFVSCGTSFVRKGKTYPPYTGEIRVFWKEHGVPADPNSYELIGSVSGRSTWCGITPGKFNEGLHKELINQAGKYGGNGIILYCGEIGTVDKCYCYGDIIRFKK